MQKNTRKSITNKVKTIYFLNTLQIVKMTTINLRLISILFCIENQILLIMSYQQGITGLKSVPKISNIFLWESFSEFIYLFNII